MKILMINSVCGVKSTGRICTDLAKELEENGHEVKIAYGREKVPSEYQKYAVRIGNDLDVKIHGLQSRLFDMSGFGSKKATQKFIEWTKKYNPDVIHLHNIHGYYINIEILFQYLKKEFRGKIIWTLHDCWAFTGHTPYCDSINCRRWIKGCYNCPLLKEYPLSLIDNSNENWKRKKKVFTNVPNMMIVTPSNWLSNLLKESFLADYPVKIINNGIDTSNFYPLKSDFKKKYNLLDKFVLLGVATSWDKNKGLPDYIKVAELLNESYQLVLVGLTKNQIQKIPKNILGIERTNSIQELVEIYSAADLFLNLSYCENFPTVNIEAISCGTPILTYKTGGSPEIVDKYGGIIIEQGNILQIVEAIKKIRKNGIKMLNINKEEYDKIKVTKQYLELY
ncbi:glycosyltransferase [uncultured Fusobacterium sp.]|uniref:glycosyltransferase n=1 Tax=uncultured Fusobacterium sp. TaxID=159267 RepID=UPI002803F919|nr:glycosyltransferase [uncultured Fusobacterium sp.]